MNNSLTALLLLAAFMLPATAQARDIDLDYAIYLYQLNGFSGGEDSQRAVAQELTAMDLDELLQLQEILETEVDQALAAYWSIRKQAQADGVEPDYSAWQGQILSGVDTEQRDGLMWLLSWVDEKIGGA